MEKEKMLACARHYLSLPFGFSSVLLDSMGASKIIVDMDKKTNFEFQLWERGYKIVPISDNKKDAE